ncbi:OLC1v1000886C1 [Oldenlandia corymbosa var. corymbosa]|uniref:OLC1v1000886C1 n=1 Tax=Oldenlandia corymbosa var. corymbosa TaxID=529605 RepID=A0AAV1D4S6_OLDCO|nr:OLC1v1000886C1 [Oldenlandia corymbosa var. corymbosa]
MDRPDIWAPESLQFYSDTIFKRLKVATELELWQESFNTNLTKKDLQSIASSVVFAGLSVA